MESIIIIGNGPSLEGKGLGQYIDSYDTIIRVGSYLNIQNEKDYGNRTTYHFIYVQCARFIKYNVEHPWRTERGSCEIPVETWMGWGMGTSNEKPYDDSYIQIFKDRFPDYNVILIVDFIRKIKNEYEKYKPEFSKISEGTGATLYAIDTLKPSIIKMIGFDNIFKGTNKNYMGSYERQLHESPITVEHDLGKERQFIMDYAREHNVNIIWEVVE